MTDTQDKLASSTGSMVPLLTLGGGQPELEKRVKKLEADLAQEKKDCITALRERDRYGTKWREFEIECNGLRSDLKKAREALKVAEHFFQSPTSFSADELNAVADTVSLAIDPTETKRWHYKNYLVWAGAYAEE